jgi:hypothetical protein
MRYRIAVKEVCLRIFDFNRHLLKMRIIELKEQVAGMEAKKSQLVKRGR